MRFADTPTAVGFFIDNFLPKACLCSITRNGGSKRPFLSSTKNAMAKKDYRRLFQLFAENSGSRVLK